MHRTRKGKQVETVIKRYHRRYVIHYHDYIGNSAFSVSREVGNSTFMLVLYFSLINASLSLGQAYFFTFDINVCVGGGGKGVWVCFSSFFCCII